MGYIDPAKEIKILMNKTGIDEDKAITLVKIANESRDATDPKRMGRSGASHQILQCITTRELIAWGNAIVGLDMTILEAAEPTFLNGMNDSDAEVVREFIINRT